jgi:N-acetylmuramoyl-L-alanine amidase
MLVLALVLALALVHDLLPHVAGAQAPPAERRVPPVAARTTVPPDAARTTVPPGHVLVHTAGDVTPRTVPIIEIDGVPYFTAAAVGGVLRATSYWRPETRKLLLRIGDHRARLGVDNPFVIIDETPYRIRPPRYREGRIWIPLDLFELVSRIGVVGDVHWDSTHRVLALGTSAFSVGGVALEELGDRTRLSIRVRPGLRPQVVSDTDQLFIVRLRGGVAPPSVLGPVQVLGRFQQVEMVQGEQGVDLYMRVSDSSRGYALRIENDPSRVEVLVADRWGRQGGLVFQPFELEVETEELPADEGPVEPGPLDAGPRLVVIDAGHGGEDTGCAGSGGVLEKHLTLEIARRLERHLSAPPADSGGVAIRVVLVRERDERIDVPRRVEIANGLQATYLVSIHCDLAGALARGGFVAAVRGGGSDQLLYEDLSPFVPGVATATGAADVLSLVRWESVGSQHQLASLQLADRILAALGERFPDARGEVVTRPVWNLEGARMPAVLVEVGALEGYEDGGPAAAMERASYLDALAAALAAGIRQALEPVVYGSVDPDATGETGGRF